MCYKALPQTQLPENINHYFHGRVVCHGERAHVKYASKLQRPRAFCWKRWGMLGKTDPGTANNPFLLLSSTFFKKEESWGEGKTGEEEKRYILGERWLSTNRKFNQHYQAMILLFSRCWYPCCVSINTASSPRSTRAEITAAIYHTGVATAPQHSVAMSATTPLTLIINLHLLCRDGNA